MKAATRNQAIVLIVLWQQNILKYEKDIDEEICMLKRFLDSRRDHYQNFEAEVNELFHRTMKILRDRR